MKILEKFATNNISIVDVKKVKNYLQKEIFTISNMANEAFIDYDIFNRYNFIVTDLIKRKSANVEQQATSPTRAPDRLSAPSTVTNSFENMNYFKPTEMTTTTTTRRPVMWKPGKTPNAQRRKPTVSNLDIISLKYFSMTNVTNEASYNNALCPGPLWPLPPECELEPRPDTCAWSRDRAMVHWPIIARGRRYWTSRFL